MIRYIFSLTLIIVSHSLCSHFQPFVCSSGSLLQGLNNFDTSLLAYFGPIEEVGAEMLFQVVMSALFVLSLRDGEFLKTFSTKEVVGDPCTTLPGIKLGVIGFNNTKWGADSVQHS